MEKLRFFWVVEKLCAHSAHFFLDGLHPPNWDLLDPSLSKMYLNELIFGYDI